MGQQREQYRTTTEGSPKWGAGHNAGCCLYAPDDVCVCAEFQAAADAEHSATEEAANQKADARIVGCGCLIVLAALLGAALIATSVAIDRAFDREVAAYSICEMCGELLDATNVHARCAGEVASYAR